jgi:putative ABC transport system ATP-binding protein
MTPVLVGRNLRKSYGPTPALRGASIAVDEGEIVAVMGPSGCGKSTLLHCLAGVLTPDAGEVHFDGQRIDRAPDRERVRLRRTAFGLVYQFGQLVPELPAVENVALPLLLAGHPRRACLTQAGEWLTRMGLSGLGDRLPGELSGGQGQRIALARALVARPRVVFADEPTGSLDSVAADDVMELLVDSAKQQGTAVLVVTHEARVAGFADRTILMRDGLESTHANGDRSADSLEVRAADPEPSADTLAWNARRDGP